MPVPYASRAHPEALRVWESSLHGQREAGPVLLLLSTWASPQPGLRHWVIFRVWPLEPTCRCPSVGMIPFAVVSRPRKYLAKLGRRPCWGP